MLLGPKPLALVVVVTWALAACSASDLPGGLDGATADGGTVDAQGAADAARVDAGTMDPDASTTDADTGSLDASGADAAPLDAGLAVCGPSAGSACGSADACGTSLPPPSNCAPCVPSNDALCVDGTCDSAPLLQTGDVYTVVVSIHPNLVGISSLVVFVVAAETAGGATVTCDDAYASPFDLESGCFNVLHSRSIAVAQSGDSFAVPFGGFTSGQRTLFLVYGYTAPQGTGQRVGLSCSTIDVGAPGTIGTQYFAGDQMRPL